MSTTKVSQHELDRLSRDGRLEALRTIAADGEQIGWHAIADELAHYVRSSRRPHFLAGDTRFDAWYAGWCAAMEAAAVAFNESIARCGLPGRLTFSQWLHLAVLDGELEDLWAST